MRTDARSRLRSPSPRLVQAGALLLVAGALAAGALTMREQFQTQRCTHNLTALWRASMMYEKDYGHLPLIAYTTTEFRYILPPPRPPSPPGWQFFTHCLQPYVDDPSVWRCPARPELHTTLIHTVEPTPQIDSNYVFNRGASGFRLGQIRVSPEEALLLSDAKAHREPHWGEYNCVFLDGHVARRSLRYGNSYPIWHPTGKIDDAP